MKQVSILLTKYSDWVSNLVYYIAGREYTHASIALGEEPKEYYSFNYKGFAVETIEKHRHRGVRRSFCFQVQISEEAYAKMENKLLSFQENQERYRYTRFGVLCCVMHLPFHWKNRYFCSQFVAELLEDSGAVKLQRKPQVFLPNHFISLLQGHPQCIAAIQNLV
ncbi:hypothetical protein [Anaerotignum sp.]